MNPVSIVQVSYAGLSMSSLLNAMPAGIGQGIIWGIMALGVYVTFRMLDVADLTVDGSFSTGGAVTAMLILSGWNTYAAILVAVIVGMFFGMVTGVLHTRLGIPVILAGILTQLSLYSINLAIMGFSANKAISVDKYNLVLSSRFVSSSIIIGFIIAAIVVALLYWYFGTQHGSAMRATGCNPDMAKAQGINIDFYKVLGLSLSNGIVALAGSLMSQFSGFADVQMGRGAIVIGLAAVIIGETLFNAIFKKKQNFAVKLGFVCLGGVVYYIVIVIVLWLKMNSNLLKLFTSIIVMIFLAVPYLREQSKNSFKKAGKKNVGTEASL